MVIPLCYPEPRRPPERKPARRLPIRLNRLPEVTEENVIKKIVAEIAADPQLGVKCQYGEKLLFSSPFYNYLIPTNMSSGLLSAGLLSI